MRRPRLNVKLLGMDIEERLEFLRQSTESLHASCQELHAAAVKHAEEMVELGRRQERLDERERRGRQAIVAGIAAYLETLNGKDGNGEA